MAAYPWKHSYCKSGKSCGSSLSYDMKKSIEDLGCLLPCQTRPLVLRAVFPQKGFTFPVSQFFHTRALCVCVHETDTFYEARFPSPAQPAQGSGPGLLVGQLGRSCSELTNRKDVQDRATGCMGVAGTNPSLDEHTRTDFLVRINQQPVSQHTQAIWALQQRERILVWKHEEPGNKRHEQNNHGPN